MPTPTSSVEFLSHGAWHPPRAVRLRSSPRSNQTARAKTIHGTCQESSHGTRHSRPDMLYGPAKNGGPGMPIPIAPDSAAWRQSPTPWPRPSSGGFNRKQSFTLCVLLSMCSRARARARHSFSCACGSLEEEGPQARRRMKRPDQEPRPRRAEPIVPAQHRAAPHA